MASCGRQVHVPDCCLLLCWQVGPQGVGLKVKDPKKYHFDPKSLLLQICEVATLTELLVHIWSIVVAH